MKPAAKKGDQVIGSDTHIVKGVPVQLPFKGKLDHDLSPDVEFEDKAAATEDSVAKNDVPHPGPDKPASNEGKVLVPSRTVFVNDKHAARSGDPVKTCNDPVDLPTSVIVIPDGTVIIGD